jgi:hypothetical protein
VDPRACLDDTEKRKFLTLPGLELRRLDRPARSQSLYRLRSGKYINILVSSKTGAKGNIPVHSNEFIYISAHTVCKKVN